MRTLLHVLIVLVLGGCDSQASACEEGVPLDSDNCLVVEDAESLSAHLDLIESVVDRTMATLTRSMPVSGVTVRIVVDPNLVIPEIGVGGFNPSEDEVIVSIDPERSPAVLQAQLPAILAHEMHHARRRQTVGYGDNLFEAMVSEGLADHFAIELAGIQPPPWSVALNALDLEEWTERALQASGGTYDHQAWFLGSSPDIPRWTGYAVGFSLTGAFLAASPTRKASTLVGEPARTFRP